MTDVANSTLNVAGPLTPCPWKEFVGLERGSVGWRLLTGLRQGLRFWPLCVPSPRAPLTSLSEAGEAAGMPPGAPGSGNSLEASQSERRASSRIRPPQPRAVAGPTVGVPFLCRPTGTWSLGSEQVSLLCHLRREPARKFSPGSILCSHGREVPRRQRPSGGMGRWGALERTGSRGAPEARGKLTQTASALGPRDRRHRAKGSRTRRDTDWDRERHVDQPAEPVRDEQVARGQVGSHEHPASAANALCLRHGLERCARRSHSPSLPVSWAVQLVPFVTDWLAFESPPGMRRSDGKRIQGEVSRNALKL